MVSPPERSGGSVGRDGGGYHGSAFVSADFAGVLRENGVGDQAVMVEPPDPIRCVNVRVTCHLAGAFKVRKRLDNDLEGDGASS